MSFWIRVCILSLIGTLAGSRLSQFTSASWWQVTPFVLLVALWVGLWAHRAQLQQQSSER